MYRLLLICLLCSVTAVAQKQASRDSLARMLSGAGNDTAAVGLYYRYGETLAETNEDSALYYFGKARDLARKLSYISGEAAYASKCLPILNGRGQFRQALELAKTALELYKKKGSARDLAVAYLNLGNQWHYLSDFNIAAENYLESRKLAERIHDLELLRKANNNLASVFLALEQFGKGKMYARTALTYAQQLKDDREIASTMYNLATADVYLKQYDSALALYDDIERIAIRLKDNVTYLDAWLGKANAYSGLRDDARAVYYFDKVVGLSKQVKSPEYEMYAYMGKADLYIENGNDPAADQAISEGLVLARKLETRYELKDLLVKAAKLQEKRKDFKAALLYFKQAQVLNDSIIGEKSQTTIANNEARYEFEKKQAAINALMAEKQFHQLTIRHQRTINYVLGAGGILLLLISFLIYRNIKHKHTMQKRRISELETEKKLEATEAIIKGEQQERSRLAKDLHDGLGGMLAGVKHTLGTMKDKVSAVQEDIRVLDHSITMLDNSIAEMRRIAHNMMPEALVQFGLDAALNDLCRQTTGNSTLNVLYQSIGMEGRNVSYSLAVTIYRIVQELLNNAIKHAAAGTVIVQSSLEEQLLTLTVEDDGKGFDIHTLGAAAGIGWKNIRSRLEYHNGKLDVQSAPGKGTSVLIEFPVGEAGVL